MEPTIYFFKVTDTNRIISVQIDQTYKVDCTLYNKPDMWVYRGFQWIGGLDLSKMLTYSHMSSKSTGTMIIQVQDQEPGMDSEDNEPLDFTTTRTERVESLFSMDKIEEWIGKGIASQSSVRFILQHLQNRAESQNLDLMEEFKISRDDMEKFNEILYSSIEQDLEYITQDPEFYGFLTIADARAILWGLYMIQN